MKTLLAHTKEINEQLARYGVKFGIYKDGTPLTRFPGRFRKKITKCWKKD